MDLRNNPMMERYKDEYITVKQYYGDCFLLDKPLWEERCIYNKAVMIMNSDAELCFKNIYSKRFLKHILNKRNKIFK